MTDASAKRSRRRLQAIGLLGVAIVVFAADQLSKNWVVANLPEGQTVPVLGNFLQWHFVRNPGAAFSMASGATWIFTVLAVVVVIAILWQLRRLGSRAWALFFALLLGGVLGNLTDRLTREPGFPEGHVIDFILTPWMWLGFPPAIYNVADIAIVSAMILFVVIALLGLPIDGSPRRGREQASEDAEVSEAAEISESAEAGEIEASEAPEDTAAEAAAAGEAAPAGTEEKPAGAAGARSAEESF